MVKIGALATALTLNACTANEEETISAKGTWEVDPSEQNSK